MRRARNVAIATVVLSVLVSVTPFGPTTAVGAPTTWHVDIGSGDNANPGTEAAPLRTIEAAVSQASADDTILVAPGTYVDDAEQDFPIFLPPGVKLASTGGAEVTAIVGDGSSSVIRMIDPAEGSEVVGFTITGGGGDGAGIRITRSSGGVLAGWPRISECIIEGNEGGDGAGIHVSGSSGNVCEVTLDECVIRDNASDGDGGGVWAGNYTGITLARCTIEGNRAVGGGGGIVSTSFTSGITVSDSRIVDNEAGGSGGGVYLSMSAADAVEFTDCEISGNESDIDGGGLWIYGCDPEISRTTVVANSAVFSGGGITLQYSAATLTDCVVAANAAPRGAAADGEFMNLAFENCTIADNTGATWAGVWADPAGFAETTLHNCIVWGHAGHDVYGATAIEYTCTQDTDLVGDANAGISNVIHDDPMFRDAASADYRLLIGSPCVDAADAAQYSATDFFGTLRPVDGDGDGAAAPDMGFHEFVYPTLGRLFGIDRYATAAEVALETFGEAEMAVIASGQNFPDALSAAGLCGAYEAPLLLTRTASLPDVTAQALKDLGVTHVIIVGGTGAVSAAVETELGADYEIMRIAGIDRYETSALIAEEVAAASETWFSYRAFIARGDAFPDALAVSPYAYSDISPILLVRPTLLPDVTRAALEDLKIEQVFVCGGTGAVSNGVKAAVDATIRTTTSDPNVTSDRWGGIDRYATAVEVASGAEDEGFGRFEYVGIATGSNFPDALAGGVGAGANQGVVLLTRTDALPQATADELGARGTQVVHCDIFGGDGAVTPAVKDAVFAALGW